MMGRVFRSELVLKISERRRWVLARMMVSSRMQESRQKLGIDEDGTTQQRVDGKLTPTSR
jgi:hypothetical protein